jgi:hypothetical protein
LNKSIKRRGFRTSSGTSKVTTELLVPEVLVVVSLLVTVIASSTLRSGDELQSLSHVTDVSTKASTVPLVVLADSSSTSSESRWYSGSGLIMCWYSSTE